MKQECPACRIDKGLNRGTPFVVYVDGEEILAYPGETIASALIAAGKWCFRRTDRDGQPRGFFCGMGMCWDCVMVVNGIPNIRTCATFATEHMRIETQKGFGPGVNQ